MTRAVGLIIYAFVLCVAALLAALGQSNSTMYYTTRAPMPPNHLVQANDFERGRGKSNPAASGLVGRYARRFIAAGERVSEESFTSLPSLKDVKVGMLVTMAHASVRVGIDPGKTVRLCAADKLVGSAHAQAVFCETSDAAVCSLVVDVSPQLFSAMDARAVTSLRAVPDNVACQ